MTVTYLGARLPQLYKNFTRGTTEGLSLFMFVLLVLGSITYVLSIFIRCALPAQYLIRTCCSFSTVALAVYVFCCVLKVNLYSCSTAC